MTQLFHGSHVAVEQPLAKAGRKNLDFGQGFYLTMLRSQAEDWAVIVASRRGRHVSPTVSVYSIDLDQVRADGYRYKHFEEYNLEWLDYVVACRKGKSVWQEYDVVEGGVANDSVIDTVEDYEKGIITAEQALGQLRYKEVNHQLCIISQQVIDNYLKYEESVVLKSKEEDK